jgi:hypothetical protein
MKRLHLWGKETKGRGGWEDFGSYPSTVTPAAALKHMHDMEQRFKRTKFKLSSDRPTEALDRSRMHRALDRALDAVLMPKPKPRAEQPERAWRRAVLEAHAALSDSESFETSSMREIIGAVEDLAYDRIDDVAAKQAWQKLSTSLRAQFVKTTCGL